MNEHLSDLALDRALAAGVEPAHCATCATCGARWRALADQQAAFMARPVPTFVVTKRRASWVAPSLLAAAVIVLAVGVSGRGGVDVRAKGRVGTLAVYVQRPGDMVARAAEGDGVVHPGDTLQWVVSLREPRFVAVLGRDARGVTARYWPRDAIMREVAAGSEQPLDASLTLDATLGQEEVFGWFCRAPLALPPDLEGPVPDGCEVHQLTLRKVP